MPKILVVEDDNTLLGALRAKLLNAGYEVSIARDGERALELIKERPDAVLLDILLPKKTGLEVLREVQKSKDLGSIPVIIISNSGQPVEIKEVERLGAKDFLVKTDFTPQDVLDKLARFVPPPPRLETHPETPRTKPSNENHIAASKGTVLIVEDDSFLRKLLAEKLKREGFGIVEVSGGKEALEYLTREVPMIILLDLVMPGVDGFQVLQEIRKNQAIKNIPIIILSNLGEKEHIDRAQSLGADDYLIKAHFILDEIVTRVSEIIKKKIHLNKSLISNI